MLPRDELGSGSAVILLHAGIADRTMWSESLEPLAAAGLRAIAIDLPGFGEAPAATDQEAPWLDILATLDELAIDRAFLVGSSFGGSVALRVAVTDPERVAGLALFSSLGADRDPSPALAAAWQAEEDALEREDIDAAVQLVLDAWTLPDAPEALRNRVAVMQRRAFEIKAAAPEVPVADDPLADELDALVALDAPALLAVGEHDMPDFHVAAEELVEALPNARRVVIPGAGHLAPLEQPEAFLSLVVGLTG